MEMEWEQGCVAQAGEKGAFRRSGMQNRLSEALPVPWFASPFLLIVSK